MWCPLTEKTEKENKGYEQSGFFSPAIKNEATTFSKVWPQLETVMLRQSWKDTYVFSLICGS